MIDRIMETVKDPTFLGFFIFIGCVMIYLFSMYLIFTSILIDKNKSKSDQFLSYFVAVTPLLNTFFSLFIVLIIFVGYIIDIIRKEPLDYNDPDNDKYPLNFIFWLDRKIMNINYLIKYRWRKKTKTIEDKWWLMNSKTLKK